MRNALATKTHYNMYKKGKIWLLAGMATAALTLGTVELSARADTETTIASATMAQKTTAPKAQPLTSQPTNTDHNDGPGKDQTSGSQTGTPVPSGTTPPADPTTRPETGTTTTDQATPLDRPTETPVAPDDPTSSIGTSSGHTPAEPVSNQTKPENGSVSVQAPEPIPTTTAIRPETLVNRPTNAAKQKGRPVQAPKRKTAKKGKRATTGTINQWMPNHKLQQMVLQALNHDYNANSAGKTWTSVEQITQDDMQYLKEFHMQDYGSAYIDGKTSFSLAGLQYATNLVKLDLSVNLNQAPYRLRGDITDLTPLQYLQKLEWLQFSGNRVADITPITGLKNLKGLFMTVNNIADFSTLNPQQYPDGLAFGEQFVEQKVTYIPQTGKYIMANPVKPPIGWHLKMDGQRGKFGIPIIVVGEANATVRIFHNGGQGTLSSDGKQIHYEMSKDQISPGLTDNPWASMYPILMPEKYGYSMLSVFNFVDAAGKDQGMAVSLTTPYLKAYKAKPVTVHYVDENGKELAGSETLSGFIGEDYTAVAQTIAGYTLTQTPANATGQFSDQDQMVTFVYRANQDPAPEIPPVVTPGQQVTLTVHHQTADGAQIAPDETVSGQVGEQYATAPVQIPGYRLVKTPANATGHLGATNDAVTYVYERLTTGGAGDQGTTAPTLPTKPTAPTPPEQPNKPGQAGTTTNTSTNPTGDGASESFSHGQSAATISTPTKQPTTPVDVAQAGVGMVRTRQQTDLPQTGERTTSSWWGMVLLAIVGGWRIGRRRAK